MIRDVVIGLGSNVNAAANVREAVRRLADLGDVVAVSPMYRSKPVGRTDQADFVNAAARLRTGISPGDLKARLRSVEAALGRVRDPTDPCGPRTIDLDALCVDEIVDKDLGIPDADIVRRWFVAVPLADVWPEWRHPTEGETAEAIAARLRSESEEAVEVV